ncbi:MAG TPA: hypothetical protein VJM33_02780 [Microthrixaceae bacterium]|nr:hypothetical protein [Microthrixaceae bacterium]
MTADDSGTPPRRRWNWAAGAVVAELLLLAGLTVSYWARRSAIGDVQSDVLDEATLILSGSVLVALLAVLLLLTRRAMLPAALTLLAGAGGALALSWSSIRNWTEFNVQVWEVQVATIAESAIPLLIALTALGLRRVGSSIRAGAAPR